MYRLKSIHTDDSQGDGAPNRQDSPRMSVLTDGVMLRFVPERCCTLSMGVTSYHRSPFSDGILLSETPCTSPPQIHIPARSYHFPPGVHAMSHWCHHSCSTSNASFYRCCFLRYKLRNGTIPVFSRPSDKSLLFFLLMTSINLEYTQTHHLEGRR